MEDVIYAYNSPTNKLPENACLLTFDDGYIDNFTYAYPVLCFLQPLFGQNCKTFLDIVAYPFWTKLQRVGQT